MCAVWFIIFLLQDSSYEILSRQILFLQCLVFLCNLRSSATAFDKWQRREQSEAVQGILLFYKNDVKERSHDDESHRFFSNHKYFLRCQFTTLIKYSSYTWDLFGGDID